MSASAPRDEFCNLIGGGLILWCLSMGGHSDLWCMLFQLPDGFYFVVDDDPLAKKPFHIHERHTDIVTLVDRTEWVKRSLLQRGWAEVDIA
jgi:hypothetical protein